MYRDGLAQQFAFFDRHLKGDLTAPRFPRVRMILRTGHGGFEWREDTSWPPESTEVRSFYLDVGRASAPGDPGRPGGLVDSPPVAPAVAAYSAEAPADHQAPGPGAVVETAPLTEDLEVAGHVNATLWVSADAADMDLYAVLRVLDRAGHEVPYGVRPREAGLPLAFGCLRVSHRALDPERSDHRRPWHTHRPADHAPLRPDEVVLVEVEMSIVTARIPAGHRLRLEIQPFEARVGPAGRETDRPGMVAGRHYDQAVHAGATNRIHSGPDHPSHLRLPLVPRRVPAPA
jgi:putative CocE/NonD family hydrolase